MKATFRNIPTYYSYGFIDKNDKDKLIKKYSLQNRKNVTFELYYLSEKLTDKDKEELSKKYNNVDFYTSINEYAPELKSSVLLICSHKIESSF